jgi:hypothetical protein
VISWITDHRRGGAPDGGIGRAGWWGRWFHGAGLLNAQVMWHSGRQHTKFLR